jgi:hypothetical protein
MVAAHCNSELLAWLQAEAQFLEECVAAMQRQLACLPTLQAGLEVAQKWRFIRRLQSNR